MATLVLNDDLYTKVQMKNDRSLAFHEQYTVAKAANSTNIIYAGRIPAGVEVYMFYGIFADTGTGNTLDVGYYYDLTAAEKTAYGVSDSPAYWWDDLDTATAALTSVRSAAAKVRFDYPVFIGILVNSANLTGTPSITFDVLGKLVGAK